MYKFEVNSFYSLETYAPSILGQRYTGLRLMLTCDYKSALAFENVEVQQVKVLADLPAGSPVKASSNTYHVFETQSGGRLVLAHSWINESSILLEQSRDVSVIVHDAQPEDMLKIKQVLAMAGYNKVTIAAQ